MYTERDGRNDFDFYFGSWKVHHRWRIWWASSLGGTLELPMIGGFDRKNGRGEFYAHEPHNGVYIYSRFIWSEISQNACRWEQAFSPDGGKTWETNWIMESTRTG